MLAMGGYTRMQSYDAARIRRARDLPPFGAPPLWDALWVLEHPAGGRTAQLLEKNDVRYIVFHKRYPWIDWRPSRCRGVLQDGLRERQRHHLRAPPELATASLPEPY